MNQEGRHGVGSDEAVSDRISRAGHVGLWSVYGGGGEGEWIDLTSKDWTCFCIVDRTVQ